MTTETLQKVNIRELVDRAGFRIEKTTVPKLEDIKGHINEYWLDVENYPTDSVGKPCYILEDTLTYLIRGIYLGETLSKDKYFDIIETMGVFTEDLLFNDIVDYLFGNDYDEGIIEDKEAEEKLRKFGTMEELYDYITEKGIYIGSDITYLYGMKTGDTTYFEELKD